MAANDKIVSIESAKNDNPDQFNSLSVPSARTPVITRRMTAPAIQVKELLHRHLAKHLQTMFDNVDDALFDLAENAPSNQQQNVFFESMRDVRFKRVEIERDFLEHIQKGFVALFNEAAKNQGEAAGKFNLNGTADSLAILEEDIVEEMVAIDSMVAKFEKQLAAPLAALDARLAHMAGLESSWLGSGALANPVSPKKLCNHFSSACRILSVDIKARIVLFKLFEKVVLNGLEQVYKQANEKLIRANVLPDYRGSMQNSSAPQSGASHNSDDQPTGSQNLSERAISVVEAQQAKELAQLFSYVPQFGTNIGNNQVGPLASALQLLQTSSYPVIGNETLFQLLHNLQRQQGLGLVQGASKLGLPELQRPEELLLHLATKLAAASDGDEHTIGQRERDIIGLVSMLFQFVLEDRVVSEPMKAAISRLQVPIIKVALNESNFFCSPSHPARRLLNEMTQAVVGWVESENYHADPLYQMICGTVERVSREYKDDSQLFVDVMADLKSWVDGDGKRTELRRKRLVDAESGRDESAMARTEIKQIIEQQPLAGAPEFVVELIEKSWSNVLFLAYVQKGKQSDEWIGALATMRNLLWTVSPQRSLKDRSELLSRLPALLRSLRNGLESASPDKSAAAEFFTKLERMHMEIMQRQSPLPAAEKVTMPAVPITPQPVVAHTNRVANTAPSLRVAAREATGAVSDAAGETAHQIKARSMAVGQWVELVDGNIKKRCRLVAILRNSGRRIFINRVGSKAAELDVLEIAALLESEKMVLLEDAQLFDKALTSIIDGLRKQQHVAASA